MTHHKTLTDVKHAIGDGLQMRLAVIRDSLFKRYIVSVACTEVGTESLYRHTAAGVPVITAFIQKMRTACLNSCEFAYLFENAAPIDNDRSVVSICFEELDIAMRFLDTVRATWQSVQEGMGRSENETPEMKMGV